MRGLDTSVHASIPRRWGRPRPSRPPPPSGRCPGRPSAMDSSRCVHRARARETRRARGGGDATRWVVARASCARRRSRRPVARETAVRVAREAERCTDARARIHDDAGHVVRAGARRGNARGGCPSRRARGDRRHPRGTRDPAPSIIRRSTTTPRRCAFRFRTATDDAPPRARVAASTVRRTRRRRRAPLARRRARRARRRRRGRRRRADGRAAVSGTLASALAPIVALERRRRRRRATVLEVGQALGPTTSSHRRASSETDASGVRRVRSRHRADILRGGRCEIMHAMRSNGARRRRRRRRRRRGATRDDAGRGDARERALFRMTRARRSRGRARVGRARRSSDNILIRRHRARGDAETRRRARRDDERERRAPRAGDEGILTDRRRRGSRACSRRRYTART